MTARSCAPPVLRRRRRITSWASKPIPNVSPRPPPSKKRGRWRDGRRFIFQPIGAGRDRPAARAQLRRRVQSTKMALMAAHGEVGPMPERDIYADAGGEPQGAPLGTRKNVVAGKRGVGGGTPSGTRIINN